MKFRGVIVLAVVGLLLVSSLDAAKPAKGGKAEKGGKSKREAVKAEKAPKVEKKVVNVKVEKTKPVEEEELVIIDPIIHHSAPAAAPAAQEAPAAPATKIVRPKTLKVVTAYEKCKQECQRVRDQQDLTSYVSQLKDELAAAEAAIEAENAAAAAVADSENNRTEQTQQ